MPASLQVLVLLFQLIANVLIGIAAASAFCSAVRHQSPERASVILGEGALLAMSIILAGTLLKVLLVFSWQEIGFFAVIIVLRLILKTALGKAALPEKPALN
jgi:hypothetical protein